MILHKKEGVGHMEINSPEHVAQVIVIIALIIFCIIGIVVTFRQMWGDQFDESDTDDQ